MVQHVYLALAGADHAPPTLTGVCGTDPGISCRLVWDLSHSVRAAQVTESFLAGPIHLALRLVFVVALALIIRSLTHALINRITDRAAEALLPQLRSSLPSGRLVRVTLIPVRLVPAGLRRRRRSESNPRHAAAPGAGNADAAAAGTAPADAAPADGGHDGASLDTAVLDTAVLVTASPAITSPDVESPHASGHHHGVTPPEAAAAVERAIVDERRHQRVHALGAILRSAASVTIFAIAGAVILGDLGINLAPLLASAGVVGIAIGFGAQNLVRDYLTGVFMLLEDQYGVGDVISVGDATGTVETMTLRITRLRDVNGIVWHIRNGTIDQVGNQSQGWARAVVDFPVPYTADLTTIRTILDSVAEAAWADPVLRGVMLEKPDVWGAQDVSSSEVTMRIVARTAPARQWEVERQLRALVKAGLDTAGIHPAPEPAGAPAKHASTPRRRSSSDS
ncbi:MAG TPA: mechanosensitive ion channel family protein [Trebonia sp.]